MLLVIQMSGPYSWEPPNYWYADQLGGAFSFLTEGGPGENPMTLESFQRTVPTKAQWPMNYEVHSQLNQSLSRSLARSLSLTRMAFLV